MNYLAHIQLAHSTNTSAVGNFLGDFVKGSNMQHLPAHIEKGVRLHRAIDSFTDQHAIVRQLKKQFPPEIRRMSGVVIDIYFDYLLAIQWQQYSTENMADVLALFYQDLAHFDMTLSPNFDQVKRSLLTHKWLHKYTDIRTVEHAYLQIENRLKKPIVFATASIAHVVNIESELSAAFSEFYPQLTHFCHTHHKLLD